MLIDTNDKLPNIAVILITWVIKDDGKYLQIFIVEAFYI